MSSSIFILKKYSEDYSDRVEENIASSFDEELLRELMVKLENKLPTVPQEIWKKFRRYALKRDPEIDEEEYGLAEYIYEHMRHNYTLDDLKEAEDYFEGDYYKDIYTIEEIPFYNNRNEITCLTKF
jgi:hypothetical protein